MLFRQIRNGTADILYQEIILDVLQKIDPQYPTLSQEEAEKLPQYKEMLQNENMKHS